MRGIISRVLVAACAAAVCGCVHTDDGPQEARPAADPAAAKATAQYWAGLREIHMTRTNADDISTVAAAVRKQMEATRDLPTDEVDAELVAAAGAVASCQERLLAAAEDAGYSAATLRKSPPLMKAFSDAGRQTTDAQARLKALRPRLGFRYQTEFPPLDR